MPATNHQRRDPQAIFLEPPQCIGTYCTFCQCRVVLLCEDVAGCLRDRQQHRAAQGAQGIPRVVYVLAGCLIAALTLARWMGVW